MLATTTSLLALPWVARVSFVTNPFLTWRDIHTSDSALGNHLYRGPATLIRAVIDAVIALAFGRLVSRATWRKLGRMSESVVPQGTASIRSYHAHLYFRTPEERGRALALRAWIGERFSVQLGRVHDVEVGPHSAPMYQVAFARAVFDPFVSWLMLNRQGLSVLVHPNTGRARDDHLVHALWLGDALPIREDVLSNDPARDVISPIANNTEPHLSSE